MLTHIPKRVPSDPVDRTGRVQAFISMVRGPRQALLVGVLAAAVILTGVVGLFVARQQTSRGNHAVEHHWHAISEMVEILAPAWSQVWADGLPMLLVALAATLAVALLWTRRDRRHLEDQVALDRERQVVAARVAEERELYLVTLQSIGDGVVATDAQGNVTLLNDVAERLTGWSRDDATGRPIGQVFRVIHETTRQPCENPVERVLQSGRLIGTANHTALLCRDGSEFSITDSGAPIRDAAGTVLGVVLVFRDITEQKRSEERFHRATVHAPFPIMLAAGDGEILEINETWARLSGYGRSDVGTVQDWMRHTLGEAHAEAVLSQESDGAGAIPDGELEIHTRVGESRYWSFNSALAGPVPDGRPSIVTMALDVTSHREAELRLRQSEKLESIGLLAGGVAHDFNNQLAAIQGYAELLASLTPDSRQRGYAENILRASHRSADLTRQLLDFAHQGSFNPRPTDVHEVIHEVVSLLERSIDKRIQLTLRLDAGCSIVHCDASQFQGALLNLAINARDAMAQGGELRICTSMARTSEGDADPVVPPGVYLRIDVTDTGTGMDECVLRRLFQPFFTTKGVGRGTGLGLLAVHDTVERHGGGIRVKSTVGVGTRFSIYLPFPEGEAPVSPHDPGVAVSTTTCPSSKRSVVVVDDENLVRSYMAHVLRDQGYEVTTCVNGREAVDLYRESWPTIDVVILDAVMPVMGGQDALHAMRAINPHAVAIICSGYNREVHECIMGEDRHVSFLPKPFEASRLLESVGRALVLAGGARREG